MVLKYAPIQQPNNRIYPVYGVCGGIMLKYDRGAHQGLCCEAWLPLFVRDCVCLLTRTSASLEVTASGRETAGGFTPHLRSCINQSPSAAYIPPSPSLLFPLVPSLSAEPAKVLPGLPQLILFVFVCPVIALSLSVFPLRYDRVVHSKYYEQEYR